MSLDLICKEMYCLYTIFIVRAKCNVYLLKIWMRQIPAIQIFLRNIGTQNNIIWKLLIAWYFGKIIGSTNYFHAQEIVIYIEIPTVQFSIIFQHHVCKNLHLSKWSVFWAIRDILNILITKNKALSDYKLDNPDTASLI